MNDIIKDVIQSQPRSLYMHVIREFLQIHNLYCISRSKYSKNLAFLGGTALRILYNTNRYSLDLDFDLVGTRGEAFDFGGLLDILGGYFKKRNLSVGYTKNMKGNVYKSLLKFPNLLYDFKLSPHKDEVLAIKLEVDINPNGESKYESSVINKYNLIFPILHRDIPSMMAGKICAIFGRGYTLGRDFYDLAWYLTKRIEPNYKYLAGELGIKNRKELGERLSVLFAKIDVNKLMAEVEPFLINSEELFLYSHLNKILDDYMRSWA